ncbi:2-oxoglutarate dehydrogenase E1 component [Coemansia sp. RSA 1646]|nr:2-oxoglutarate dehydrogenase E1 component [Coemansia sp. RSA 1646]
MVRRHEERKGRVLRRERDIYGHDDFSQLNRALKKSGLYCKEMDGDGNCLFRALADQVDGSPETHMRHRQSVCDYMDRNPDEFAPFMDESSPLGRYINNMRNPGVYGGNMELVAFARNFLVDIKVYQMGGTVFVISGAPAENPRESARNLQTVHIAYHSYEHYSSVRNRDGPHSGMPDVKESTKLSFTPVLNDDLVDGPTLSDEPDDDPPRASADDKTETDSQDSTPGPKEKIVIASTGVSNLFLVRRLLRENRGDEGQVIELLIQWMADDPDNPDQWWADNGPTDYAGPPHPLSTDIQASEQKTNDTDTRESGTPMITDDAVTLVDDRSVSKCSSSATTIVEDNKKTEASTVEQQQPPFDRQSSEKENSSKDMATSNNTAEDHQQPPTTRNRQKHVKGAARQKKAESKKRQKEMAKMKKRKAAREAVAPGSATSTKNTGRTDEETALELSNQISQIYI